MLKPLFLLALSLPVLCVHATADPSLIKRLSDPKPEIRKDAAIQLGQSKDAAAIDALIKTLADDNGGVAWSAAQALGEIGSDKAVAPLIKLTENQNWGLRYAAAKALGQIGHPNCKDALFMLLTDDNTEVRDAAAQALRGIGLRGREAALASAQSFLPTADAKASDATAAPGSVPLTMPQPAATSNGQPPVQTPPLEPALSPTLETITPVMQKIDFGVPPKKLAVNPNCEYPPPGCAITGGELGVCVLRCGGGQKISCQPVPDAQDSYRCVRVSPICVKNVPFWRFTINADGSCIAMLEDGARKKKTPREIDFYCSQRFPQGYDPERVADYSKAYYCPPPKT
ncbi:MAG: HEAT repeat domain-containing protein [Elusimicrobiota bacterium]|mgnify:FL=1